MGMLVVVIVVMVVVDDGAGGGRGDTIMVVMGMMIMMMSDNPDAFNAATPNHSSWLSTAPQRSAEDPNTKLVPGAASFSNTLTTHHKIQMESLSPQPIKRRPHQVMRFTPTQSHLHTMTTPTHYHHKKKKHINKTLQANMQRGALYW